jgi:glycosyltransferase involved in cell wall biosynthesis
MTREPSEPIRVMRIIARMNVGGPAVQVAGLMRGFNVAEFNHRLFTGFCGPNEADFLELAAKDVQATRIQGLGRHISILSDVRAFVALVRHIRSFKPHIIHTHTAKAGFLGRLASLVSFHRSIRIHTFHGHLLQGYFGNFGRTLVIVTEKSLALFTHYMLAVGNKVRSDLLDVGIGTKEKFGLMPPGLKITKLPLKSDSRNALNLSQTELYCGFIGRVNQIKRPDRFLDVVSELKKRNLELSFFMAGDGELLNYCYRRIESESLSVKLLGWQSDMERVLSAADMVVLTSDNEGMPLSLIQAGMSGLPVVATNVGSVSEVVIDGTTGFVTSVEVVKIADALENLVKSQNLRHHLGENAKHFTLHNFGVERLVSDHEKLYRNLILSLKQ